MGFKVVNTIHLPGVTFGDELLEGMDVEIVNAPGKTEDELIANAAGADAVICSGPVQPWSSRVVGSLSQCRIIASLGVGYDRIDLDTATNMGIVVTNVPDYCIDEVSGMAIALMMALGRKLFLADRLVRDNHINMVPPNRPGVARLEPVFRMAEQTVGIVGMGKIGTAVALKARGLGMSVMAYDPYVYPSVMKSHGVQPVSLDTLIAESDFISINAALNEETRAMFGREEFQRMKSTAYLINTARGEIVRQEALIEALHNGWIAGAGLDVTEKDPIPADDPILKAPNVILTGHSGWYSSIADSEAEFWHKAMAQVKDALDGKWPLYAVNPEVRRVWMKKWSRQE